MNRETMSIFLNLMGGTKEIVFKDNMTYNREDAVKLSFTTDKLPKNNKKLYEKFPDLKGKLDELEEKGLRAYYRLEEADMSLVSPIFPRE